MMPATPIHGMKTLTTPQVHTPSITPTSKVAPALTHSTSRSAITTTPLTTSLHATSTLGTVKHTLYPEHTPTTTRNQVLPATT